MIKRFSSRRENLDVFFIKSANENLSGWQINYELLWEDDFPDAMRWVKKDF